MIEDVLSRLDSVRKTSAGYIARCPSHTDRNPSLSIREAEDRVLLFCHAGCDTRDVCQAMGMEVRELFKDVSPAKRKRIEAGQSVFNRLEWLRQQAFLEMVDFRNLARELYNEDKLESEGDVLWAKHQEPLIEYYLSILATGNTQQILELVKEGVIEKWARLRSSQKTRWNSSRELMLQST